MIKITEIELENFGRHRHIKQKLEGNVVGLTGPNGRGKSTILQGIQFAITGMIDHPDPLSKFIRQGNRGGVAKSATVKLAFEVDGRKGVITRKITKTATSRELTLEGLDGPVSADKRVAEIMFQLLEVDKRALGSTVFIRQGAIADMFGKETDRREFYTRLLMLGHLTKIADVVDGYRKTVASSVIDLSSVLDEAENAQKEATDNFTDAESRLKATDDCTETLEIATRISMLFGDQAAAHDAVTAALAKLGDDPDAKLTAIEVSLKQTGDRLTEISTARLAHSKSETAHSEAIRKLNDAEALWVLCLSLADTLHELSKHKLVVAGGDSSALVTQLQRKVEACDLVVSMDAILPDLQFERDLAVSRKTGLFDSMTEKAKILADAERVYDKQRDDLKVREDILREVRSATDCSDVTQCVVCGSNTANAEFLERTSETLREAIKISRAAHWAANDAHTVEHSAYYEAVAEANSKQSALDVAQARRDAAVLVLDGFPAEKSAFTTQLEAAKLAAAAYTTAAAEVRRLEVVYTGLKTSIADRESPTAQEITDLKAAVEITKAACQSWDPALDAEELQLQADSSKLQLDHAFLQATRTDLAASRQWLNRVQTDLETACMKEAPKIPDDIYIRGMVMTPALANEILTKLQARQADYDHLRGMHEAARTAMLAAQRRVVDAETKIENQKQRVTLVERLSRLASAFKPSGVSLKYLDYKFGQVATVASDYLAESGADFTVMASPGEPLAYDFIRMEPGEDWLSQSRLSGGQRVRLAVATLRAIHSLVVPNVGLLVLDEPTTHLDSDAKLAMAEMLRRIGSEGGLQILVCDHDPVLIDAFSSTIEIPE
jgi:exonuclease SbcC